MDNSFVVDISWYFNKYFPTQVGSLDGMCWWITLGSKGAKQAETVLAKLDTQDWKALKGVGGGGPGRSLLHESTLLIILRITDRVMHVSTAALLNLRGALLGCFWIMRPSFDQRDTLATGHRIYSILSIYTYIYIIYNIYIYIAMWTDLMCIVHLMQYLILFL